MVINNVGYKFAHGKYFNINRPNGSGDYMILFLRTGAVFRLEQGEMISKPQSFILYKKGTPQYYRTYEESFVNDWLHFDLDDADEARIAEMGIPFDTPVHLGDISFFSGIIKNMYREKYSANRLKDETLKLYFELITIKLAERIKFPTVQKSNPHYEKISGMRARIYNDPGADWSVDAIADELALSPSYFQHLYKRYFETNVSSDIIASRIERAQYLLLSTDYAVSYIASECGYKNDVHFMRQFKSEVGITPSAYRRDSRLSNDEKGKMYSKAPYKIGG